MFKQMSLRKLTREEKMKKIDNSIVNKAKIY